MSDARDWNNKNSHPQPKIGRAVWWSLIWFVLLGLGVLPARALDPLLPPGANFDLTHWKLTLPLAGAPEASAAQLSAGYTNAPYFYTGPGGEMVFWCPVTGGTTSGSSYPRSELREMLNPTSSTVNWSPQGTHTLDAQCRVLQVPSTGKVIIGQIHGYSGNAYPLIKLQYFNGLLDALVKHSPNSSTDTHYYFMNVGLNNLITYQIKVTDGLLSLTVNGSNRTVNIFQTDPDWANQTMYFKAGNYCQDNSGPGTEGSLVVFEQLSVSHVTNGVVTRPGPPTNLRVANGTTNQPPPVATNLLPAQVLNLTNWKLTLPVNTAQAGTPDEYKQPQLATFVDTNYFYVNNPGNGVVFTAHAGGYTTSGSGYPRSELREMVDNGANNASWSTTSGTHSMIVTQAITHLPDVKPHVVAGQIHDANDDVIVFRLENKKLFIDENGNDGPVLTTDYNLGDIFTVQFLARNGGVECYYNGNYIYTYAVNATGCYFKAGCYTQSNTSRGDAPTAYGQVVIYGVSVTHGSDSVTNPPPVVTNPPPPVVTSVLPAQVLNLTNWKLTLPVNTAQAGTPDEYKQPQLATFVDPNYFYVNATSNGVVFTAHAGGYTTSGSGYPRSELREMTGNGANNASWSTTSGTHSMIITQAITHLPDVKPHVVAGQIHDANDDVIVFRLENQKLFIDENGADGPVLTTNYNLGDIFTVQFLARNGGVECYYNGNYVYTYTVSATGCYFKTGCYTQSNLTKGDLATAYGQVVVYGVSVTHQ